MYPYFVNKVKYESEMDPTIIDVYEFTNLLLIVLIL